MAQVVLLRGINVGGYRNFRPSLLAKQLCTYDVVNIGAAGTFVVRQPCARAKFLAALHSKLPFEVEVAFCNARDLLEMDMESRFQAEPSRPDTVHFVSVLAKAARNKVTFPISIPDVRDWFVRIIGSRGRLVFGEYRRHMKTIGYLGQIDNIFGASATTRSWSTIQSVLRILKEQKAPLDRGSAP